MGCGQGQGRQHEPGRSPLFTDGLDPLSQAVNGLTRDEGVLFVVAAGNSGAEFAVSAPAPRTRRSRWPQSTVVDQRAWFSSMGPRSGDHALKPDIAAPGVDVTAARSQLLPFGEGMYQPMDGTSMATPHVAGAAAILAAAHPAWSPRRLKDALMSSAKALPGTTPYEVGTGRLDIPAALAPVHATGSAFLGFYKWPHDGDAPVVEDDHVHERRRTPVRLARPERRTYRVSSTSRSDEVTVPAGGSVDVNVTADADDAPGVGRFTGFVVATDASGTVSGPYRDRPREGGGALRPERPRRRPGRRSRIRLRRRSSTSARRGRLIVQLDPETGAAPTQRLAPGPYNISTWMDVRGSGGPDSEGIALLAKPHFVLDRDQEVVLDARKAKRITVTTPRPSENRHRRMQYFHDAGIPDGFSSLHGPLLRAGERRRHVRRSRPARSRARCSTSPPGGAAARRCWTCPATSPRRRRRLPVPGRVGRLDGKVRLGGRLRRAQEPRPTTTGVDASGKAVVIRRSDAVQSWDWSRSRAGRRGRAADRGERSSRQALRVRGGAELPVVSVTKAQGDRLIAAARAGKLSSAARQSRSRRTCTTWSERGPSAFPPNCRWRRARATWRRSTIVSWPGPGLAYEAAADCHAYSFPPCMGLVRAGPGPVDANRLRLHPRARAGTRSVLHSAGWEQRHDQVTYDAGKRYELRLVRTDHPAEARPRLLGPRRATATSCP